MDGLWGIRVRQLTPELASDAKDGLVQCNGYYTHTQDELPTTLSLELTTYQTPFSNELLSQPSFFGSSSSRCAQARGRYEGFGQSCIGVAWSFPQGFIPIILDVAHESF